MTEPRKTGYVLKRLIAVLAGLIIATFVTAGLIFSNGGGAPDWAQSRFENQINARLTDVSIGIGDIRLVPFHSGFNPTFVIKNIVLRDGNDQVRAALPAVEVELSTTDLIFGRIQPVTVEIIGARARVQRNTEGKFDLSIGEEGISGASEKVDLSEILTNVDTALASPYFSKLKRIDSRGTSIAVDDQLAGRQWLLNDGIVTFSNAKSQTAASASFKLATGRETPASATFAWRKAKNASQSEFSAKFSDIRTEDIADQVAAFDWLRILDAPLSGSMALTIGDDATFGNMNGVLEFGAGTVLQQDISKEVKFSDAKAYLSYDRTQEKFTFDEISAHSDAGEFVASGHAYLSDRIDRTVGGLIAQLRFSRVSLHPPGIFSTPVEFELGALDMRIQLDPLVVDLGQLALVADKMRIVAKGQVAASAEGWKSRFDLTANGVSSDAFIRMWPETYKPKTRVWLVENVLAGMINNVTGAFRASPNVEPRLNVGFDLSEVAIRFMKHMPPIEGGSGYGFLGDGKLNLVLEKGLVTAPNGSEINVAGTVFQIANTRIKNSPAAVQLNTQSSVSALLSTLDLKPFEFMSKAGMVTDLVDGTIKIKGKIAFPLVKKVTLDLVDLSLEAVAKNPTTTKLVKGKTLAAETLKIVADNTGLTISGDAKLGGVPINGLWRQDFGPTAKGKSRFEGQIEISNTFLQEFNITLPKGAVEGRGSGHVTIDLVKGQAPAFRVVSDLNRVALRLDALGWKKPKNATGRLRVIGSFGDPPSVSSLEIEAKGFKAAGNIKLKPNGKLDVARFDTVDVGGWFVAPVEIRADNNGSSVIGVTSGKIDFRRSKFGQSESNTNAKGTIITAKLDRLILSNGISLTDIEGDLNTSGGITGSFAGRVNGGARIVGTLAPHNDGTGVRFTSSDGGAVMRSAGIFESAYGGRMDMILIPATKRGHYNGSLEVKNTRVRGASGLADLLSAISVVGLLEQLGGDGIAFNDVNARFELTPSAVQLHHSSAVGASLGLTMEGYYDFKGSALDMQGVITPIYLLNGILEQTKIFGGLFGKQKGEGLFGFNYTLKGKADEPKVGVNPLSILTPGLFREIFRQPIPKPSER